jgi:hypothetical protein
MLRGPNAAVKSDTKKILEKCTDDELRRLEAITGKTKI